MNEEVSKIDILKYFKPDIIDKRQLNIEEYDESDLDGNNKLIGHMNKRFVRIDTSAIPMFVQELQSNPNCCYVSCANDVIKEGIVPEKISVMLKTGKGNFQRRMINNGGSSLEFRESIASKLLNWLECPTCYNFVVRDGNVVYVASVDFISDNEKFYSLEDFEMRWSYDLKKMFNDLNSIIDKFEFNSEEDKLNNKKQVFDDFMYTLLIREALLSDGDYHTGNIGLLYNEKEKSLKFVNFDMEFLFLSPNLLYRLKPAMSSIRTEYPNVYNKFIDKTRQIYANFDKMKMKSISIFDEFSMYHTLIGRVKSILKFDKHMIVQDKLRKMFSFSKAVEADNVK